MHEVIISGSQQKARGIRTHDIAKRLLDYGIHPPTVYFPLIVSECMMIEPTESESRETLDEFIDIMRSIDKEIDENPDELLSAPHTTPIRRLDEAAAARSPGHPLLQVSSPAETIADNKLRSDLPTEDWFEELGLSDFVAVDLETTGLDPQSEQIIEIGAVRFRQGRATDEFQTFLSCSKPLDSFIIELTGITDHDLKGAPTFKAIANDFSEFLADSVLVGQNVDFDFQFLSASGRRIAESSRDNLFSFRGRHILDTAMMARIFWPEMTKFSLDRLCNEFGVTLEQAHRATADARGNRGSARNDD